MSNEIEIVCYRKSYDTFCVTVDRERSGDTGITSNDIAGLIRSGHAGIVAKRDGLVVGFAFYKIQSRTSGNKTTKTLWITRISTIPSTTSDETSVSSEILKHLKRKAIEKNIRVAALIKHGSCIELGAEAAHYVTAGVSQKEGIEVQRIESGRGARSDGTRNRISQYFQGK